MKITYKKGNNENSKSFIVALKRFFDRTNDLKKHKTEKIIKTTIQGFKE